MSEAAWESLDDGWRAALEEAWWSWCAGSAGVGAAVVDARGVVVARNRNRRADPLHSSPLGGSRIAHAEMCVLASLPDGSFDDCTLYTTFEPCLMCASAIVQIHIGNVCFAAADPVFDGLHDWLGEFAFAAERLPQRSCLGGPVGSFAHVLHLSWLAFWLREGHVLDAHKRLSPRHLDLARRVAEEGHLADVASAGGSVVDAMTALWPELVTLAG